MPKLDSSADEFESYGLSKIWPGPRPKIPPSPIWLIFDKYIAMVHNNRMMPKLDSSAHAFESYGLSKIWPGLGQTTRMMPLVYSSAYYVESYELSKIYVFFFLTSIKMDWRTLGPSLSFGRFFLRALLRVAPTKMNGIFLSLFRGVNPKGKKCILRGRFGQSY